MNASNNSCPSRSGKPIGRQAINLLCAGLTMAFMLCTHDYNPFTDESNARAMLIAPFADGDTVDVFSTETVTVALAVRDLIDTFSLHVDASRYFGDTAIGLADNGRRPDKRTWDFTVSFYDTGWQELRCSTKRKNGDEVVERRTCYARSPLRQDPVIDTPGTIVCLATPPVQDRDVMYFWSFGKGVIIASVPSATCQVVQTSGMAADGQLWVAELNGSFTSPRTPFLYTMADNEGPQIICVNDGAVGKDTIVTSTKDFHLRIDIIDRGGGSVLNATVNNEPFDIIREQLYIKKMAIGDAAAAPVQVIVRAADPFSNESIKKLWVVYDPTARTGNTPRITIIVPSRDSMMVSLPQWSLYGMVESPTTDSFIVAMEYRVNGTISGERQQVHGIFCAPWSFTTALQDGVTTIAITARDSGGTAVAETSVVMIYDGDLDDITAPVIVELQVNRQVVTSKPVTVDEAAASLRIVACDAGRGVDQVLVNGKGIAAAADGAGYVWTTDVTALHTAEGARQVIMVRDRVGLYSMDTVAIRQNRLPSIVRFPKPPLPLIIGSNYVDTIAAADPDGDMVRYSKSRGPRALSIDSISGALFWTPLAADRGTDTVAITLQDPFGALLNTFTIRIVDTSDLTEPVRFLTAPEDFPGILEATIDTLRQELNVVPGTGRPPLRFMVTADRAERGAVTIANNAVVWAPQLADTGRHLLTVTVIDSFDNRATLYPQILVVEPNRPCSLSYRWTGDVGTDGSFAMSGSSSPETLAVTIHDPDGFIVDTFSASMTLGDASGKLPVTGGRITVLLDPAIKKSGSDTLRIVVADKAGHTATLLRTVYYGLPPAVPQLITPVANSLIRDTTVTFTWTGGDPDGLPVQYTLLMATGDTSLVPWMETVNDQSVTVNGLTRAGRYYWQIHASDGKSDTTSAIGSFVVDPLMRIRFATGEEDFPSLLEVGRDSLRMQLNYVEGTGRAPFIVSVTGASPTLPVVAGSSISWRPTMGDAGICYLSITVRDAIGNGDTLLPAIRVIPQNRPPVLSLRHSLDTTSGGAIDLSESARPETLFFTINDPDVAQVERFTVHTRLRHTESIERERTDSVFTVVVDARSAEQWFDTLTVWVTDRGGLADTVRMILFNGNNAWSVVNFTTTATGALITENVTAVPVLLRLDTTNFDFVRLDTITGAFRFYKADGTALPYEVENISPADGIANVWVLMDTVFAGRTSQSIYISILPGGDQLNSGPSVFGGFAGVWHMEKSSNVDTITDVSGHNNSGTCVNMDNGNMVDGIAGPALAIDSNQYVNIGNRSNLTISGAVTVETWVFIAADNLQTLDYQPIINKGDYSYFIDIHNDTQRVQFGIGDAGGWWYTCPANAIYERGRWYHIVGRFDGSEVAVFIDGKKQSTTWTGGPIPTSTDPLQIGHSRDRPARWFRGLIDEVRISAKTHSDSWIKVCHEGVKPGSKLLSIRRTQ